MPNLVLIQLHSVSGSACDNLAGSEGAGRLDETDVAAIEVSCRTAVESSILSCVNKRVGLHCIRNLQWSTGGVRGYWVLAEACADIWVTPPK